MATYTTPSGAIVDETGKLLTPPTPPTPGQQTPEQLQAATKAAGVSPQPQPQDIQSQDNQTQAVMPANGSVVDLLKSTGHAADRTALKQLATQFGIQNYHGTAAQNTEIAKKYLDVYNQKKNAQAPDTGSQARQAVTQAITEQQDQQLSDQGTQYTPTPAFMGTAVPALQGFFDMATAAIKKMSDYQSLKTEFQPQFQDIQGLDTQLVNMRRIMNGTSDDIQAEVAKAGGFITESQLEAMVARRNNTLLKQYNSLVDLRQSKVDELNMQIGLSQDDRNYALKVLDDQLGIGQNVVQLQTQMNTAATDAYQKIVTNAGYTGLANAVQGNPQRQTQAEQLLGLTPGTLSNPTALKELETYKEKQLQLGQQRIVIQSYNAGLGTGTGGTGSTPTPLSLPQPYQDPIKSNPFLPKTDAQGRATSLTDDQVKQLQEANPKAIEIGGSDAGSNQYGDNVVVKGVGFYIRQPDKSLLLSQPQFTQAQTVDEKYREYKNEIANSKPIGNLPRMIRNSYTRQVNAALSNYEQSPIYQSVSNASLYLSRISAANTDPGSISDTELADSIIKINTGGGQVTDAQLSTYFAGQSFADKFAVFRNKLTAKGGVLSPQQRADLTNLANSTFGNYKTQFEGLYVQAMDNLKAQSIPSAFWGNLPDFSSLLSLTQ